MVNLAIQEQATVSILAVDDISENLELLVRILEREDYHVLGAINGQDALNILATEHIDLIISDILMPVMDGYQFCRHCQQSDKLQDIPFVFYTATYTDDKDKKFGLELGARRFLIKPLKTSVLLNAIKQELEQQAPPKSHSNTRQIEQPSLSDSDQQYLRQYSSRLVKKLEDKLIQLEQNHRKLQIEMDEQLRLRKSIETLNAELESRVQDRTQELVEANQKLLKVDHLKDMFIASMSHELRTPLNSIIGFTGIILQGMSGELTDEQTRQLGIVKKSSLHLLSLINDIIDVSKIGSGAIDLTKESFDFVSLVHDVIQILSKSSTDKGIEIDLKLPESLTIYSDKRRVKQILINLIDNAIKFTDLGTVTISLSVDQTFMNVTVTDTGIGIDKKGLGLMFQPFSKLTHSTSQLYKGTGLGLYLSQSLAHIMGGNISVVSEIGFGSNFTLTLPLHGN